MNTAIILAARKERDSEIPFPLLEFTEGVCLIDRTLALLRESGLSKIIIVAGYKSEMFQKYVADDVKVLVNPNYVDSPVVLPVSL